MSCFRTFNLFLARRGLSAAEIGLLAAIIPVCKTIIPPFWARGGPTEAANWTGLALVAAAGAPRRGRCWPSVGLAKGWPQSLLVLGAFWTAHHPLVEVTVLESLDRSGSDYGARPPLGVDWVHRSCCRATGIAIDLRSTDAVVPILTAILLSNLQSTFVTPRGTRRRKTGTASEASWRIPPTAGS